MVFFDGPSVVDATRELYHNNDAVKDEFAAANLEPLLIRHLPEYRLLCKEPIRTLDDLKGKKVRTYGNYVPRMFAALGAVPVTVLPLEMNEALQRGTVDCIYLTYGAFHIFKLYKSGQYLIDVNFGTINAYTVFVNKSEWESWPEELRTIVKDAAANAEAMALELNDSEDAKALQAMLADGAELVHFEDQDALVEAVPDMVDVWVETVTAEGKCDQAGEVATYLKSVR
jgi:TRAP-type C4-dicarboxylate transport system substrate-binding protein